MRQCKEMCDECPFSKNSLPGFLGPYESPESLHTIVMMREIPFPCHKTHPFNDADLSDVGTKYPLCAGALAYMAKNAKLPRDSNLRQLVLSVSDKEKANVFSVSNFLKHHCVNNASTSFR